MRVFVAGANGAVGRRLVPMLVARGHQVTGTTTSEESADAVRAMGTVDLLRSKTLARQIVFSRSWPAPGQHTLMIVNIGTPGRGAANVDGFLSLDGRTVGAVVIRR